MFQLIALDELDDSRHTFVILAGSMRGEFPLPLTIFFQPVWSFIETPFSRSRRLSNQVLA